MLLPAPAGADSKVLRADSKAQILPTLELCVSHRGPKDLSFGDITPSHRPGRFRRTPPRRILIEIFSNTGEKYHVTQILNSELSNKEGRTIAKENFRFRTSPEKSRGRGVRDYTPVSQEAQTIFTSDEAGTSESISALYELNIPSSQPAGDYSALLTYTVSSV